MAQTATQGITAAEKGNGEAKGRSWARTGSMEIAGVVGVIGIAGLSASLSPAKVPTAWATNGSMPTWSFTADDSALALVLFGLQLL